MQAYSDPSRESSWKHYDLGIHTGSKPRLCRFIRTTPIGVFVEDEKLGVRYMVAPDAFVALSDEQREAYEQGCPLGYVASMAGKAVTA